MVSDFGAWLRCLIKPSIMLWKHTRFCLLLDKRCRILSPRKEFMELSEEFYGCEQQATAQCPKQRVFKLQHSERCRERTCSPECPQQQQNHHWCGRRKVMRGARKRNWWWGRVLLDLWEMSGRSPAPGWVLVLLAVHDSNAPSAPLQQGQGTGERGTQSANAPFRGEQSSGCRTSPGKSLRK